MAPTAALDVARDLLAFVEASPTPFHAVAEASRNVVFNGNLNSSGNVGSTGSVHTGRAWFTDAAMTTVAVSLAKLLMKLFPMLFRQATAIAGRGTPGARPR